MAKTKKANDGDEMIDDDDAPVATASKKTRTPKASKNGSASKAKRSSSRGTSKPKAKSASKTKTASKASAGKRERKSVEHKTPKAGSKFTAKYKGKTHTMTVKKAKDGSVAYVVKGKAYKSPSSAASAVIDTGRSNGWTFWGID